MISSKIVIIFLLLENKKCTQQFGSVHVGKVKLREPYVQIFFPKASKPGNRDLDVRAIAAFGVYTN